MQDSNNCDFNKAININRCKSRKVLIVQNHTLKHCSILLLSWMVVSFDCHYGQIYSAASAKICDCH